MTVRACASFVFLAATGCVYHFDSADSKADSSESSSDSSVQVVPSGPARLTRLDIAASDSVFVAKAGAGASANALYKITVDGDVVEAAQEFVDATGQVVSSRLYAIDVRDAGHGFLLARFSGSAGLVGFLVQRSGGRAVQVLDSEHDVGKCSNQYYWSSFVDTPVVSTDAQGVLYLCVYDPQHGSVYDTRLARVEVSADGSSASMTYISATDDLVRGFLVEDTGAVVYGADAGGNYVLRLRSTDGRLFNLDKESFVFLGAAQELFSITSRYVAEAPADADYVTTIERIFATPAGLEKQFYASLTSASLVEMRPDRTRSGIATSGRYFVSADFWTGNEEPAFLELQNPEATIRVHDLGLEGYATVLAASGLGLTAAPYVYVAGPGTNSAPALKRLSLEDDTVADLLPMGAYDVHSMTVDRAETVTFSAVRMADGKRILGRVDRYGNVRTLSESLDELVVLLPTF
jgi:hypothetical protein